MKLKVLSWNIHKGIGGVDRRYSLERVANVIATERPDIAVLQEVSDGWPATNRDLQVERLSILTEMPHLAFAPEHRFSEGGYGNAILSRFPIIDRQRVDLKIGWRKQRSALSAVIALPSTGHRRKLIVGCVHLGLAESERRAQLRRLFEADNLLQSSQLSILAGDYNDVFGTLEQRFLRSVGFSRAGQRRRSFPAVLPVFCLDGIYTRGMTLLASDLCREGDARRASDHLPLVATFEIPD
jgi:endonuclease/exonuclease/phosphatase family metal-dependent hydrolase